MAMRVVLSYLVTACLLLISARTMAAERVLQHDTGKNDGKQSMAGTGHVIEFDAPKGTWYIEAVQIYGCLYGGGYDPEETLFEVAVCDSKLNELVSVKNPYSLFNYGKFEWVDIPIEQAVEAASTFKIVASFNPTQTKGCFVGWSLVDATHSSVGLPGGRDRPYNTDRDWMIRVVLTSKKPKSLEASKEKEDAETRVLRYDTGKNDGKKSLGGSGHVVTFKSPPGTWYIQSVQVYGSPYGGDYDPASLFTVSICDSRCRLLASTRAEYRLFPLGRFAWGDVPMEEVVKAPRTFKAMVGFNPTATRGVFVGYSTVKRSHSSTGLPGEKDRSFDKDKDWMIRVTVTKKKPDLAKGSGAKTDKKSPSKSVGVYMKDFEFLEDTVRSRYPALKKKGIDWKKVCAEWKKTFRACKDDKTHILNAHHLLAVLNDMHTGITRSSVEVHVPSFDGMYGGGIWIAVDRGRLVLRALMPGHHLKNKIVPGAELILIDGRPAPVVHEEVKRRMKEWSGWSSDHFLDARLSFQFFHFGDKDLLPLTFINPDGSIEDVKLPRWGPGGRGLSRQSATMPEDVEAGGAVVSKKLNATLGYIRILGGMSEDTRQAFDKAFDALKGVEGIVLDCRGMGGGGDGPAWAMAGRFYSKNTSIGINGTLEPGDSWQFDGPVVMLQDEREVSSAETFTWSMTETGRAISVGRSTGGGTIIPRMFEAPSGLFSFRMGCTDRPTPIKRIKPEGIGTPPDVFVPYEPVLLERHGDPAFAVACDILLLLIGGAPREKVVDYYGGILGGDPDRVKRSVRAFEKLSLPERRKGFHHVTDQIIESVVAWEIARCNSKKYPMPGFKAARERLDALASIAKILDLEKAAEKAGKAGDAWKEEIEAEEAYLALVDKSFPPEAKALDRFLDQYGETRYGRAARSAFPKSRGKR